MLMANFEKSYLIIFLVLILSSLECYFTYSNLIACELMGLFVESVKMM